MKTNNKQNIKAIILGLVIAIGAGYVSAWTGPTAPPTGGNVPAPINVGGRDGTDETKWYTQTKSGILNLAHLITNDLQITTGTPAEGKILKSDSTGIASWVNPSDLNLGSGGTSTSTGTGCQIQKAIVTGLVRDTEKLVTFATAFPSGTSPIVVVTPDVTPDTSQTTAQTRIYNVTNTGFKAQSQANTNMHYIAMSSASCSGGGSGTPTVRIFTPSEIAIVGVTSLGAWDVCSIAGSQTGNTTNVGNQYFYLTQNTSTKVWSVNAVSNNNAYMNVVCWSGGGGTATNSTPSINDSLAGSKFYRKWEVMMSDPYTYTPSFIKSRSSLHAKSLDGTYTNFFNDLLYTRSGEITFTGLGGNGSDQLQMIGIKVKKVTNTAIPISITNIDDTFYLYSGDTYLAGFGAQGNGAVSPYSWSAPAGDYNLYFIPRNTFGGFWSANIGNWIDGTNVIYNGIIEP